MIVGGPIDRSAAGPRAKIDALASTRIGLWEYSFKCECTKRSCPNRYVIPPSLVCCLAHHVYVGPRGPSRQVSQQKDVPQRGKSWLVIKCYPSKLTVSLAPSGGRTSSTSTTTINQARHSRDSSRNETPTEGKEQRWENFVRRPSVTRREQPQTTSFMRSPTLEEEDLSSSSTESDSEVEETRRVPRFRKFGKFSTQRIGLQDDADDDEDDTPAFLPLSRENDQTPRDRPGEELSATLRLDAERAAAARRRMADRAGHRHPVATESSTSSMSSGAPSELDKQR